LSFARVFFLNVCFCHPKCLPKPFLSVLFKFIVHYIKLLLWIGPYSNSPCSGYQFLLAALPIV
jgi:hypothetical protein